MMPMTKAAVRAPFLWLTLAAPALLCLGLAMRPEADPDEITSWSGQAAMLLLAAALASSGLARWLAHGQRLLVHRRALGLAAFGTSVVHLALYAWAMGGLDVMLAEALVPGIWTGWAALALLVPLALTSRDAAMRRMGAGWKRLQRLAWPAVGLALAHTYIVHDGQSLAIGLAGLLALVQLSRYSLGRTP
jgi:sulfoxide reductase heme-binding subunit YedZ